MFHYSILVLSLLFLTACGSSPKTNFYTLSTATSVGQPSGNSKSNNLSIGVWEVKLPALLDRSEMITRNGQHGIEIADFHKWAGGLANSITQSLANQLSLQLGTNRVVVSPWLSYVKQDYQIRVKINRFDGELGKEITLKGVWVLLNKNGHKEVVRESFNLKMKATDRSYAAMAATFSQLTVELSTKIVKSITSLQK